MVVITVFLFVFIISFRVVSLQPNKLLGVVGEHRDFPIERIRLSFDKNWMGSCSHDKTVKFWNVSSLVSETGNDSEMEDVDSDEEGGEGSNIHGMEVDEKAPHGNIRRNQPNFFSDL